MDVKKLPIGLQKRIADKYKSSNARVRQILLAETFNHEFKSAAASAIDEYIEEAIILRNTIINGRSPNERFKRRLAAQV